MQAATISSAIVAQPVRGAFGPQRIAETMHLPAARSSGLAAWQLRRTTAYLEQHACEAVRVADLAAMVGLSISHFARAFKASTGLPPHLWQTQRRIRTAQQMMIAGEQPLVEIALATGFSDQSHFTRVFRARTGTTPGAWQRHVRSMSAAA